MKQLLFDQKKGEAKLKIENEDDLWYLSQIIDVGDIVKGKTLRKIKIGKETDRAQAVVKKPVFIAISAEKIEYANNSLRVLGIITEGPEDVQKGEHHTFALEQGITFTLQKERWLKYQLDRLKEATKESQAKILIVVIDREEADIAILKKYGYDVLASIKGNVKKKAIEQRTVDNFYQEISEKMAEYVTRYGIVRIILASPAFWKEELMKEINDESLKKKIILATCYGTGRCGIDEVLKRPEVKSALHEDRTAREIALVEELLTEISKGNLAVYGLKETESAVDAGAVNNLLITDGFIKKTRENNEYGLIENLLKITDSMKGMISIVSSAHDGGKKLDGLGGIAGLLRYKLSY